jgi:hypothetical protein
MFYKIPVEMACVNEAELMCNEFKRILSCDQTVGHQANSRAHTILVKTHTGSITEGNMEARFTQVAGLRGLQY